MSLVAGARSCDATNDGLTRRLSNLLRLAALLSDGAV